jgi:hypothetical protein
VNIAELGKLQKAVDEAQDELTAALKETFPCGHVYKVRLRHRQKYPTEGTVIGHGSARWAGRVRLRLHTREQVVRDFPWPELEK